MLIENKNQYDKLLDEISGNDLVKFEIIINDAFLIIRTTKDRYQLRIAQLENRIWQLKMGSKPEMFEPIINQLPNFDPSDLYKFINNPDVFINKSETDLIFGADRTENVVSIEINEDGNVEIFKEINGEIQIEHRNYKFWMVSNKAPSKSDSTKLDGGLFYRNLIEYNTKKDFFVNRKIAKNRGVEVFSISNEKEQFMVKNGLTYFKNSQISDVSVLSFDIETTSLRPEDGQVLMISNTFRKCGKITKKLFSIDEFHGQNINPESAMIRAWCTWVRSVDPSIMIGHNIYSFDLAYLNDRYQEGYNGNLPIGRDGSGIKISTFPSKFRKDGSQAYDYFKIQIYGREIVDTWFLSMKYDFKRNYPSYKLKEIIEYEGLIKEGRTFYDASTIRDNWDNLSEREKIKKYCIDDSDDSLALYDLMVPMYFYYTRSIPKPFQMINESATGSQLNALMVRSYLQIGHSLPTPTPVDSFQGATSLGVPGIYQNVFKIDVQSLYPSIIIQYQLYDKYKDPNAHYLKLVEYFTNERLNNKRKGQETNDGYYKDLEQGQKIAINSFYGLTGANGLIYNSPKIASKITQYGREILDISVRWATSESVEYWQQKVKPEIIIPKIELSEKYHNYILGPMDTDSLSFCKRDYSEFSENERQSLIDEINYMLPKHIIYTDDGYYKSIVIVATKNYILHEHGTDKIKFKGSSLTDQKKEPILLEMIKEIGNQLLIRDIDVSEIYNKYVKMTETVTDVRPWCAKKTVTKAVLAGGDVGARSQERKLYEVIRGIDASEGDKIYVYNTQYGMKEDMCKGEVKCIKIGKMELKTLGIEKLPKLSTCVHTDKAICYECNPDMYQVKMVPNYVLKLAENFDPNKPDTVRSKLLGRVFKTLEIFDSIVDKSSYPNYSLKTKQKLLADLT